MDILSETAYRIVVGTTRSDGFRLHLPYLCYTTSPARGSCGADNSNEKHTTEA